MIFDLVVEYGVKGIVTARKNCRQWSTENKVCGQGMIERVMVFDHHGHPQLVVAAESCCQMKSLGFTSKNQDFSAKCWENDH
jgi:hypothetical protein